MLRDPPSYTSMFAIRPSRAPSPLDGAVVRLVAMYLITAAPNQDVQCQADGGNMQHILWTGPSRVRKLKLMVPLHDARSLPGCVKCWLSMGSVGSPYRN
jgi:hypothetical protein